MRIIEENIQGGFFDSPIFSEYFGGMSIAVADIETTGLSPKNCAVILGGVILADSESRTAVQYFADSVTDEEELLERYVKVLAEADVIVTYNGQKFDIPFLKNRMKKYGLDTSGLDGLYSMDMYKLLRNHSHLPKLLPNMKQKTVEAFLGDAGDRTDEIDGGQSVELYYEYCGSTGARRGEILDYILLHNRDDIVRLSDMMRILKTLDLHEIMYSMGFPVAFSDVNAIVENAKFSRNTLVAKGRISGEVSDYVSFDEVCRLQIMSAEQSFTLKLELERVEGFIIADLKKMGVDGSALWELGGYESGYLILMDGSNVRYQEVNKLIKCILYKALQ